MSVISPDAIRAASAMLAVYSILEIRVQPERLAPESRQGWNWLAILGGAAGFSAAFAALPDLAASLALCGGSLGLAAALAQLVAPAEDDAAQAWDMPRSHEAAAPGSSAASGGAAPPSGQRPPEKGFGKALGKTSGKTTGRQAALAVPAGAAGLALSLSGSIGLAGMHGSASLAAAVLMLAGVMILLLGMRLAVRASLWAPDEAQAPLRLLLALALGGGLFTISHALLPAQPAWSASLLPALVPMISIAGLWRVLRQQQRRQAVIEQLRRRWAEDLDPLLRLPGRSRLSEQLVRRLNASHAGERTGFCLLLACWDIPEPLQLRLSQRQQDDLLRAAALRIEAVSLQADTLVRWERGGFLLLADEQLPRDAERLLRQLRVALQEPIRVDGLEMDALGWTLGLARWPQDGLTAPALIHAASQPHERLGSTFRADGLTRKPAPRRAAAASSAVPADC